LLAGIGPPTAARGLSVTISGTRLFFGVPEWTNNFGSMYSKAHNFFWGDGHGLTNIFGGVAWYSGSGLTLNVSNQFVTGNNTVGGNLQVNGTQGWGGSFGGTGHGVDSGANAFGADFVSDGGNHLDIDGAGTALASDYAVPAGGGYNLGITAIVGIQTNSVGPHGYKLQFAGGILTNTITY
jgi:hypothetical protein